jgi:hypothetical protein
VFEFDEEKVANRLIEEGVSFSYEIALQVAGGRHDLHEKLRPAFLIWLNGGIPEFAYEGFTLESLKELVGTNSDYTAILHMDRILKNPEEKFAQYKNELNFLIMC